MAESDKIKHSDIIEEGYLYPAKKEAQEYLVELKKLEEGLKSILGLSKQQIKIFEPKTVKEAQNLEEEIKKVDNTTKALDKTQKQIKDTEQKLAASRSDDAKKLEAVKFQLNEQNKANRELVKNELAVIDTYKKLSKELEAARRAYKNLFLQGKENTAEAKALKDRVDELDGQLKKADAAVGQFGRNVGNYQSALDALPGSFGNAARGADGFGRQLLKLLKNPFVLVITGISAALFGLSKAFTSTDEGAKGLDKILEKIAATFDVIRQRAALFSQGIIELFKLNFSEAGALFAKSFEDIGAAISTATEAADEYIEKLDELEDAEIGFISQRAKNANQIAKLEFIAADSTRPIQERINALREALRLSEEEIKKEANFARERFNIELEKAAGLNNINKESLRQFIEADDVRQAELLKNDAELRRVRNNLNDEGQKQLEELFAKSIDTDTRFFEENKKNLTRLANFYKELFPELEKARVRTVLDSLNDQLKAAQEAAKKQADFEKDRDDQLNSAATKRRLEEAEKVADEQRRIRDKEVAEAKKAREQAIADSFATAEAINQGVFDGLERRSEFLEQQRQKELDSTEKQIETQQRLAEKGQENNLAFLEKKRVELQAQQEREKEKERQREEAQQLANTFLEFLQEYTKENPNTAASRAFAATLVARGVSRAIAGGGLYEGTDSVKESDAVLNLNTKKDNLLVPLHATERVIGVDDSKRISGMTNEDVVKAAELYRMGAFEPETKLINDINPNKQAKDAVVTMLQKQIENLTKAVKNKKEININWDNLGARVEEVVENSEKKVYKYISTGKKRI